MELYFLTYLPVLLYSVGLCGSSPVCINGDLNALQIRGLSRAEATIEALETVLDEDTLTMESAELLYGPPIVTLTPRQINQALAVYGGLFRTPESVTEVGGQTGGQCSNQRRTVRRGGRVTLVYLVRVCPHVRVIFPATGTRPIEPMRQERPQHTQTHPPSRGNGDSMAGGNSKKQKKLTRPHGGRGMSRPSNNEGLAGGSGNSGPSFGGMPTGCVGQTCGTGQRGGLTRGTGETGRGMDGGHGSPAGHGGEGGRGGRGGQGGGARGAGGAAWQGGTGGRGGAAGGGGGGGGGGGRHRRTAAGSFEVKICSDPEIVRGSLNYARDSEGNLVQVVQAGDQMQQLENQIECPTQLTGPIGRNIVCRRRWVDVPAVVIPMRGNRRIQLTDIRVPRCFAHAIIDA